MKIVCTVTNDLSHDQRMDRICRSLTNAGHEVTLVGRMMPDSTDLPDRPYRQVRLPLRFSQGKLFYLEYNWRLYRWLRKQHFNAINSVDYDSLLAGYLARKKKQKLVFDAHEYFSETPEVIRRPLVRTVWRKLGQWLVPKADLCYTVGPELAKIFSKNHGKEFGVVRNVPLKKEVNELGKSEKFPPLTNRKIILYQGWLNAGRGLETAIAAMRQLPDFELWLAGKGDLKARLQSSNADLVEQGRVRFLGFVPMDELPELTQRAWLGLNLLDAVSPSYYYSLANKCFDYIQAGVPSVQMNFPEYRNLQDKYRCFLLLPELNADKLVGLVRDITQEEERYLRLKANNERAAKELCWEREELVLLGLWAVVLPDL